VRQRRRRPASRLYRVEADNFSTLSPSSLTLSLTLSIPEFARFDKVDDKVGDEVGGKVIEEILACHQDRD
jgi:hypothetical protein